MESLKDVIEKINVVDAMIIVFCGVGLVIGICQGQNDVVMSLGAGMFGYAGGKAVN